MRDRALSAAERRTGIAAAIGCVTAVGIGIGLGLPLLSLVLEARGVPGLVIGLVTAMGGLATLAVAPLTPRFMRRLGVPRTLMLAVVLAASSFLAFYWAGPLWLWFALRFLNGAGLAVLFVASEFWINALAPPDRRGLVMGLYATVLSLGFAAGPALLAVTGSHGPLPFAVGTALALSAAPLALLGAGAAPRMDAPPRRSLPDYLFSAPTATLAALVFGAVETGSLGLLPVYGLRIGLDEAAAALLVAATLLGNVGLQIPIGLLSDRMDRRRVLVACAGIGLVGALLNRSRPVPSGCCSGCSSSGAAPRPRSTRSG